MTRRPIAAAVSVARTCRTHARRRFCRSAISACAGSFGGACASRVSPASDVMRHWHRSPRPPPCFSGSLLLPASDVRPSVKSAHRRGRHGLTVSWPSGRTSGACGPRPADRRRCHWSSVLCDSNCHSADLKVCCPERIIDAPSVSPPVWPMVIITTVFPQQLRVCPHRGLLAVIW